MRKTILAHLLLITSIMNGQNVGIGTLTPSAPLHIRGTAGHILRVEGNNPYISLYDNTDGYRGFLWYPGGSIQLGSASGSLLPVTIAPNLTLTTTFLPNGNVGLGTNLPASRLDILGGQWDLSTTEGDLRIGNGTYRLKIGVATGGGGAGDARIYGAGGTNRIIFGASTVDVMAVSSAGSGSVIIGGNMLPAAGYKLSIRGKIMCEEMKVQLQGDWPDYVFDPKYKLPEISSLEQFIQRNHHLPGLPSATEVEKNGGFHVGEMQTKLLEKIEELTLYVIELDKKIQQLQLENTSLRDNSPRFSGSKKLNKKRGS